MLKKLLCNKLNHHKVKTIIGFTDNSYIGYCKRCHKLCIQNNGKWIERK